MLEEYIIRQIQMTGDQGISLGTLGNRIRIQFGDFKVRIMDTHNLSSIYKVFQR